VDDEVVAALELINKRLDWIEESLMRVVGLQYTPMGRADHRPDETPVPAEIVELVQSLTVELVVPMGTPAPPSRAMGPTRTRHAELGVGRAAETVQSNRERRHLYAVHRGAAPISVGEAEGLRCRAPFRHRDRYPLIVAAHFTS
jgi:hypothetical protein